MEFPFYTAAICAFGAGITGFPFAPKKLSGYLYFVYALGSALFGAAALQTVYSGVQTSLSFSLSGVLDIAFRTGGLSAFFALVLSILGFAVSVYSAGYMRHEDNASFQGVFYGLFLMSIYAVFYAGNMPAFLVSWETMSLVSYFLVVSDSRNDDSRKAGLTYATMTHIGTAFIIAAFMIAYAGTGTMDFEKLRVLISTKPVSLRWAIFVPALTGFGIKAGIVPLHIWLPKAHPAAPSNVSALMSGVMIKTGIYGIVLFSIYILGGAVASWGVVLLVLGAVSSVLGVLYALMEHDMKRLLAYHSVENIGIILLGVGASIIFQSYGLFTLAGLALAAALYHTLNHAVFKGLLFMGAGSVLHGTHTKNIEEMGGLLKRMPWTGLFFLVGSISICALPPTNGFVSEWLTYQSLVLGSTAPAVYAKVLMLLAGTALALTGALAADCFIKAFGISFLGMPRSAEASGAKESSRSMLAGMAVLAACCLALGIFPNFVLATMGRLEVGSLPYARAALSGNWMLSVQNGFSTLSPIGILAIMLSGLLALLVFIKGLGRREVSYGDSWDCGIRRLTPRMQYTATAFTKPLRQIFKRIYLPTKEVKIIYRLRPFFAENITYNSGITPFFEKYGYGPAVSTVHKAALRIRKLQSGSLHLYLGYILLTLLVLLFAWG